MNIEGGGMIDSLYTRIYRSYRYAGISFDKKIEKWMDR